MRVEPNLDVQGLPTVLPVELLSGHSGLDLNDARISPRLRSSLGNQNRMWNIDPVGDEIERLALSFA